MPNDPDFAAARATQTSAIPVIDLSDSADLADVAKAIKAAAEDVGFFYLSGHGIPPTLMEQAFTVARRFFDLPQADKATVAVDTHQRGWMATGLSRLEGSTTHDLKEVFFWGAEVAADDPDLLAGKPLVARNQWPDAVFPDLQRDLTPYYDAVCAVARRVLSAIAISLDQPVDMFAQAYARPLARGQLVYYPPSTPEDETEGRFGVAPHTDFGVLTFLMQDMNGGLQVQAQNGTWIEAPPIEGTLVCNIGDLLQRWSNDRFASTVHRVINRSGRARYSIPVFFDPASDAVIDPRDLGAAAPRYDPVTAGEHIMGRNRKNFAHYKDTP